MKNATPAASNERLSSRVPSLTRNTMSRQPLSAAERASLFVSLLRRSRRPRLRSPVRASRRTRSVPRRWRATRAAVRTRRSRARRAASISSASAATIVALVSTRELIDFDASTARARASVEHQLVGFADPAHETHREALVGGQPLRAHQRPASRAGADQPRERQAARGFGRDREARERALQPGPPST